ncbi:MAG: hypothetical protein DDT31_01665 [Syntrophomonadaceae bacterium]|nr:hypothetical protein [Bacillota bacterium]
MQLVVIEELGSQQSNVGEAIGELDSFSLSQIPLISFGSSHSRRKIQFQKHWNYLSLLFGAWFPTNYGHWLHFVTGQTNTKQPVTFCNRPKIKKKQGKAENAQGFIETISFQRK